MSKPITIGQSHNVISILANNVNWDALANSGDVLQWIIEHPRESGEQFTLFLSNGGKMILGEPRIILIDRNMPFDPVKLLSTGWTIEEQDERSLALTRVNLANVRLEHMLKKGEGRITGEERLKRLKNLGIQTDVPRLLQALEFFLAFNPVLVLLEHVYKPDI